MTHYGSTDRTKIAEAIRATKNFPGVIGETSFDERGENTLKLITTFISENGKWIPYYKSTIKVVNMKLVKQ